jgi:amino acid permease
MTLRFRCHSLTFYLVFGWFVNLASTFGALTWMTIAYSHMWVIRIHLVRFQLTSFIQLFYGGTQSTWKIKR